MSQEENIRQAVAMIEAHVEDMYQFKYTDSEKPPPVDVFKASAMAEIARRIGARAHELEEQK